MRETLPVCVNMYMARRGQ